MKAGAVFHPTRTRLVADLAVEMKQVDYKGTVSLLKIIDCESFAEEYD